MKFLKKDSQNECAFEILAWYPLKYFSYSVDKILLHIVVGIKKYFDKLVWDPTLQIHVGNLWLYVLFPLLFISYINLCVSHLSSWNALPSVREVPSVLYSVFFLLPLYWNSWNPLREKSKTMEKKMFTSRWYGQSNLILTAESNYWVNFWY